MNIPTALSQRETEIIRKVCKDKHVVELGSLFGYSTINIANVAKSVLSIDPHEGYPTPKAPSTKFQYLNNLQKYGTYNVHNIFRPFQNVGSINDYNVGFIDLDGTYGTTKQAIKKLQNVPTLIIHDFNRQNCKGVEQAIRETNYNLRSVDSCIILEQ